MAKKKKDVCIHEKCYSAYRCNHKKLKECDQEDLHRQGAVDCNFSSNDRYAVWRR